MSAYIFPGQGSQFPGMGKDLYEKSSEAKELFEKANDILGFDITKMMFEGTEEDLKQTKVTQPCVFLHSVIAFKVHYSETGETPEAVAGHSLGELSALTSAGVLAFEDGLRLVAKRAEVMQKCCENQKSAMAAVLGLEDSVIEEICKQVTENGDLVVAANYNCPGQVVISGAESGVEKASQLLENAGAKRIVRLQVGGAFHSPLMKPASEEFLEAVGSAEFKVPVCPVYQNVTALATTDTAELQRNLTAQMTSPVRWTETVKNIITKGVTQFYECGPGNVLAGLMRKIDRGVKCSHLG